jgi:hypothetical protein
MARGTLVGELRLVSQESVTDGYSDTIQITRNEGDLRYDDHIYTGGVMQGVIEYKGKRRSKSFHGEMAHSDLERWIGDTLTLVIHAGKGI